MAHDASTRAKVRAKFVQGVPLETAAEACDVPYNTARNWKRAAKDQGDDWDIARRAKDLSRGGVAEMTGQIMEDLVEQFAATMQLMRETEGMQPMDKANILLKLSDAYVKTMAAAARGNPKLDRLSVAMDVIQQLCGFIVENFPDMRQPFLDAVEAFGPELAQRFGPNT
jgi:hypothetical protein